MHDFDYSYMYYFDEPNIIKEISINGDNIKEKINDEIITLDNSNTKEEQPIKIPKEFKETEEFENICSKKSVAVAGPSAIVFTLNGTAANIYNLISSADSAGNYIHYALAYMMEDIETKTTTIYKIPTYYKILLSH